MSLKGIRSKKELDYISLCNICEWYLYLSTVNMMCPRVVTMRFYLDVPELSTELRFFQNYAGYIFVFMKKVIVSLHKNRTINQICQLQ